MATLRPFSTAYSWGKSNVEAGFGYDLTNFAGGNDRSFAGIASAGIEFQPTTALTITPFVRGSESNGFADHHNAE